jgi:hypothetical protein
MKGHLQVNTAEFDLPDEELDEKVVQDIVDSLELENPDWTSVTVIITRGES